MGKPPTPAEERFWPKVDKAGPVARPDLTPCWPWTGYTLDGYGRFGMPGEVVWYAHRMAWVLAGGTIPKGFQVLHVCDVRPCVRNDEPGLYCVNGFERPRLGHLWVGTPADNTADMIAKRRAGWITQPEWGARGERNGAYTHPGRIRRGEDNGNARLTWAQVDEIRRIHAEGGVSQSQLARTYEVPQATISRIVLRKGWRRLSDVAFDYMIEHGWEVGDEE